MRDQTTEWFYNRLAEKDAEIERLKSSLECLVNKLDAIGNDPQFNGIFSLHHIHGGRYTGPNWSEELQCARDAIKWSSPEF